MLRILKIFIFSGILTVSFSSLASKTDHHHKYDKHDVLKNDHLDEEYHNHEEEEKKVLAQRIKAAKTADIYSCRLESFSAQCREYPIPKDAIAKLTDLSQSCTSLPKGEFKKNPCPSKNRVGRCMHILRNYHDPKSLIYDNHYYTGSRWTMEEIQTVCQDLEGKLVAR